ncbi:MAG: hypothetical protein Kow0062_09540 [Acidobacteriota bacterium]
MSVAVSEATALSCPRCGGTPDPDGGPGLLARCSHCGVLGRIDDPEGWCRLVVIPRLEVDAARGFVEDALAGRGVSAQVTVVRSERLFLPWWRVVTLVAGRVDGQRELRNRVVERDIDDQGFSFYAVRETSEGVEPVRREIQRRLVALVSGCPMDELGIPTLDRHRQLAGGLGVDDALEGDHDVRLFDPGLRRLGTFLDPLVPRADALRQADEVVAGRIEGFATGMLPGADIRVEVLARDVTQFWYPVLHVVFDAGAHRGRAVIDACTGRAVSLALPHAAGPTAADRRVAGLVALGLGALTGSVARLALAPPALLAGPDAGPIRARLLVGALLLAGVGVAGLRSLVRQIVGAGR